MKTLSCLFGVLSVCGMSWGGSAVRSHVVNMTPIPRPAEFSSDIDRPVPFDSSTAVTVECPDAAAVTWLNDHFAAWYGAEAPKCGSAAEGSRSTEGDRFEESAAEGSRSTEGDRCEESAAEGSRSTEGDRCEESAAEGSRSTEGDRCEESAAEGSRSTGQPRSAAAPAARPDESYRFSADASGVRIAAPTLAGVRYAAYTIRQIAIARRGTLKTSGRILPTLKVADRPALAFRAMHLCWFPDAQKVQMERAIRLAALLKFNHVIIEPWGTFRSERNPWFGWPNAPLTKAEIARLVALGKDLGVTLVPQLNAFGHASGSRACTLKHATLDLDPDYEPLFEPGGWNWCLTNPVAQTKLREIIAELHDAFGRPPFFHLGCDEAQPPTCPDCRKVPYGELVCRHVADLAAFVASRGARAMIWHDMLLKEGDARWSGFTASGSDETVKLADLLPKDVVVCDWEYGDRKTDLDRWPTTEYLIGKGFPVAASPFLNWRTCGKQAEFVAKHGGFGYVQTTWNCLRGNNWVATFRCGACAAWGTPDVGCPPQYDSHFANALRLVGYDMKVTDPEHTGLVNRQTPASWTEGQ